MKREGQTRGGDGVPPLPGRALHLRLQPARRLMWVGAGWAALCGAIAAGIPALTVGWVVRLLITVVLADTVLGAAWAALLPDQQSPKETARPNGGSAASAVSLAPRAVKPVHLNATARADEAFEAEGTSFSATFVAPVDRLMSGAERLYAGPARSIMRWRSAIATAYASRLREASLAYGLALLVALWLGPTVAVFVALGLVFPLVVWFALGGYPLRAGWTRALLEIGLPWAVGMAAFSPYAFDGPVALDGIVMAGADWSAQHLTALAVGALFTAAYCGMLILDHRPYAWSRLTLLNAPQLVAVVLLVVWAHPVLAGGAAMLVLAQMLFQPHMRHGQVRWYLAATQWLFMGVMLATALGLGARIG
jgi:hypothetical protein